MPELRSNSITLALVVLCGLTTAAIWLFELPALEANEGATPASANGSEMDNVELQTSERQRLAKPPMTSYSEILERPVFRPSRRPTVATDAGSAEVAPLSSIKDFDNSEIRLVGIIIVDENRFALLQAAGTQLTQRVQVGDVVDGWRITRLTPSTAAMEHGADARTLQLERRSDPKLAARAQANKRRERLAARIAQKKQASAENKPVTDEIESEPQHTNDDNDE
jgi:general secretion pathway protein N